MQISSVISVKNLHILKKKCTFAPKYQNCESMKKIIPFVAVALLSLANICVAEEAKDSTQTGFQFTTIDSVAITRVKDQNRSGTCWCYSGLSFLESELLRTKGIALDLSEMFVVSHTMMDRATYYVRQYGEGSNYAEGGNFYDVLYCMSHYGLVPQEAMPGIRYGASEADSLPVHTEVFSGSNAYLRAIMKQKKLSPVWKEAFQGIWDTYLGKRPESFEYAGKTYTPRQFADFLGLKADDYVSLTSYTHHPFYERFALEVPDNWRMNQSYNLPLNELMEVIENALDKGYTMAWGADVSEDGFTRTGIGVVPDAAVNNDLTGSDAARWLKMKPTEQNKELAQKPGPEKNITQEMRQQAFDSWETQDDHGMQIFGRAKDQTGKKYYMIKNSWGTVRSDYHGIWYISEAYMQYKTNEIVVHKDALPKHIRKKLGL